MFTRSSRVQLVLSSLSTSRNSVLSLAMIERRSRQCALRTYKRPWTSLFRYRHRVAGFYAGDLPETIDGDLLRLVHLSNGFRMLDGKKPFKVCDVCQAEAHVASVINSDSGKAVKAKGQVMRAGKPFVEVVSSFLYRGRFTDFENTFEIIEEPDYTVEVKTDSDVGVHSDQVATYIVE